MAAASGHSREHLDRLGELLAKVDEALAPLHPAAPGCGSCGRCCTGPPIYMTLTSLEHQWLREGQEAHFEAERISFEPVRSSRPDRRHAWRSWTCPLYSIEQGCTAYARRPLACRVFGPMSRHPIEWSHCSYQAITHSYTTASEIPHFDGFTRLIDEAKAERGYLYRQQVIYERPALAVLLGIDETDELQRRIRVPLPTLEALAATRPPS